MPIDRETFETASQEELAARVTLDSAVGTSGLSAVERVAGFLLANDGHAFRPHEIAGAVGLSEDVVGSILGRLKAQRFVEQKATYWAATDRGVRRRGDDRYERATRVFDGSTGSAEHESLLEGPDGPYPGIDDDR
jgi:hypothetical protein